MNKITTVIYFAFLGIIGYSQSTVTVTINSPGSSSWQVPCGISSITVHCWGGGGAGGAANQTKSGAGGGGAGGYASSAYAVTAGSSISYTVGAGAASTAASSTVTGASGEATTFSTTIANGGSGGGWGGSGAGSGTSGSGGAGGTGVGTSTITGGGGSNGSGAASSTGGAGGNAGGPGGGTGGASSTNNAGNSGNSPGGGGSGGSIGASGGGLGSFGGAGGGGQISIVYTLPITVNAGADQTLGACTTTNTTLSATSVSSPWSGSWSCSGCSGVTISNTTSPTSAVSGNTVTGGFLPGSSTTFIWTVTNGTCSYQDEVVISVPACAQANPDCGTAQTLTIDNSLICGQNTNGLGGGADGCVISGSGQTVWYKFTVPASTNSLVLNVLGTASPYPNYGLFSGSCAGLTCAQNVTYSLSAGDPGKHTLLTGLTPGATYYVQVQSSTTSNSQFCISLNNVASNSTAPANALSISNCGVTYNGTTNGGYYPSGSSAGFNNLDGNNGTTVTGASQAGDDVTFVVNDISWFKFCTVNAGTYNVQFDVISCVFSGANSGSQMAILTGTDNSMTNIWQATNPTQPATSIQTSPNFALAAGGCAYLVVDGFAGDACTYSYVLTNVSGGCILLPIEFLSFTALQKDNYIDLTWATATEKNNDYFTVEKSSDGVNFKAIEEVDGAGTSADAMFYSTKDSNPIYGLSYYRLKQIDFNGKSTYSKIISVDFENSKNIKFDIVPNPNTENSTTNIVFNTIPDKEFSILITDLRGVVLFKETKKSESEKIQIPNYFASGTYFVKIVFDDFVQTKQLLINNTSHQ